MKLTDSGFASRGKTTPLVVVISGPSGVGKDALVAKLKGKGLPRHFVVTATTRPRRKGEIEGVNYHFVSEETFRTMISQGELFEWANVYGNLYGVPRREVEQALTQGLDVIVKTDVQGVATIKKLLPGAVSIFVAPPSLEELERRLTGRKTEAQEHLQRRLEKARHEMECCSSFDHVVVNQEVNEAVSRVEAIILAEKRRRDRGDP